MKKIMKALSIILLIQSVDVHSMSKISNLWQRAKISAQKFTQPQRDRIAAYIAELKQVDPVTGESKARALYEKYKQGAAAATIVALAAIAAIVAARFAEQKLMNYGPQRAQAQREANDRSLIAMSESAHGQHIVELLKKVPVGEFTHSGLTTVKQNLSERNRNNDQYLTPYYKEILSLITKHREAILAQRGREEVTRSTFIEEDEPKVGLAGLLEKLAPQVGISKADVTSQEERLKHYAKQKEEQEKPRIPTPIIRSELQQLDIRDVGSLITLFEEAKSRPEQYSVDDLLYFAQLAKDKGWAQTADELTALTENKARQLHMQKRGQMVRKAAPVLSDITVDQLRIALQRVRQDPKVYTQEELTNFARQARDNRQFNMARQFEQAAREVTTLRKPLPRIPTK